MCLNEGSVASIMSEHLPDHQSESDSGVAEKTKEPRRFKVLLHNDHYTTMDFVTLVLVSVFYKTEAEATRIMLSVHQNGVGVCGIYTQEIAETKVSIVRDMARRGGYPLKCSMEEV